MAGFPTQVPLRETTPEKTATLGGEVNEPAEEGLPDNRKVRVARLVTEYATMLATVVAACLALIQNVRNIVSTLVNRVGPLV